MHLRNIAKYHGAVVVFDCIEFNENLRWIDVISEIAFIEMDLYDRNRRDFGTILLNVYLQNTGDYPAMRLLRYYMESTIAWPNSEQLSNLAPSIRRSKS